MACHKKSLFFGKTSIFHNFSHPSPITFSPLLVSKRHATWHLDFTLYLPFLSQYHNKRSWQAFKLREMLRIALNSLKLDKLITFFTSHLLSPSTTSSHACMFGEINSLLSSTPKLWSMGNQDA
ncbi:hypothetical protein MANES_04G043409v8 [Manihot esculenta]|uniref:Uncharacterized protein n=1 Tax=Manihot esculenta TaxID=3983 RepID=A0ACB7HRP6_MANES|nr:hypothetical protein MANES_04G043409v8 [Manihot esculenta]